jgi:hypothetical protein
VYVRFCKHTGIIVNLSVWITILYSNCVFVFPVVVVALFVYAHAPKRKNNRG